MESKRFISKSVKRASNILTGSKQKARHTKADKMVRKNKSTSAKETF